MIPFNLDFVILKVNAKIHLKVFKVFFGLQTSKAIIKYRIGRGRFSRNQRFKLLKESPEAEKLYAFTSPPLTPFGLFAV